MGELPSAWEYSNLFSHPIHLADPKVATSDPSLINPTSEAHIYTIKFDPESAMQQQQHHQHMQQYHQHHHHHTMAPSQWTPSPHAHIESNHHHLHPHDDLLDHPHSHTHLSPHDDDTSPSHASSHCSSPFNGSNGLDEPVWLESDLGTEEASESEASHSTTPLPQPFIEQQQQQVVMMTPQMPTICEQQFAIRPKVAEMMHHNEIVHGGIGMLPMSVGLDDAVMTSSPIMVPTSAPVAFAPSMMEATTSVAMVPTVTVPTAAAPPTTAVSGNNAAVTSSTRGKRRGRAPASSSVTPSNVPSSSSMLMASPSLSSQDSISSMVGSAHSSEPNSEDDAVTGSGQDQDADELDEEYDEDTLPSKNAKRKRVSGSSAAAAAAAKSTSSNNSPSMKGLDKRERNKLSASMYRKRRKVYLDSLEGKVGELDATIAKQNETIARQAHENKVLKEQLSFLKKMVAGLKNPLASMVGGGNVTDDTPQPTNLHLGGAPRRTLGQSAGAFLFLVMAVCLLFNPTFLTETDTGSSLNADAIGRRGRSLLSVDDSIAYAPTDSYAPGIDPAFFESTAAQAVQGLGSSSTAAPTPVDVILRARVGSVVEFTVTILQTIAATLYSAISTVVSTSIGLLTGSTAGGEVHGGSASVPLN